MIRYYELVGGLSPEEFEALKEALASGKKHPREAKMELAKKIAARFYGEATADEAEKAFNAQFRKKEVPDEMEIIAHSWVKDTEPLTSILSSNGAVKSASEARRLIKQGGLAVNGERINDERYAVGPGEYVIRLGKKKYVRLTNR